MQFRRYRIRLEPPRAKNGLIENHGAIGKDSFFILEATKASQGNKYEDNDSKEKDEATMKYTPYSDFLWLHAKVEVLVKAYEGSQAVKGKSESELKQEILLLKKENESLTEGLIDWASQCRKSAYGYYLFKL